jgi:hypothetical protein
MTWSQYDPDIWEAINQARTLQVRKRIWDQEQQQFLEVHFVRVFVNERSELNTAIEQHRRDHGEPQYQGAWWHDDRSIWLRESLATWWLLKTP